MIRNFGQVSGLSASPPGLDTGLASPGGTFMLPTQAKASQSIDRPLLHWAVMATTEIKSADVTSDGYVVAVDPGGKITTYSPTGSAFTSATPTAGAFLFEVCIGPDDFAVVGDNSGNVRRYNPKTGTFTSYTVSGGVRRIKIIDGFCYIVSVNGNAYKYNYPAMTQVWATASLNASSVNIDITADSNGNVYVVNAANQLFKLDPATGATQSGYPVALATIGVNAVNSLGIDKAGNLYYTNTGSNAFIKLTPPNTVVWTFSGFTSPIGVATDVDGEFLLINRVVGGLMRLAPDGVTVRYTGGGNIGDSTLQWPPNYRKGVIVYVTQVSPTGSTQVQYHLRKLFEKISF